MCASMYICICVGVFVFGCVSAPSIPNQLVLHYGGPQCVRLMDVRNGVVSLSRMCNEPCFASVTFELIDYKQRPLNMQRFCLLTMQHSFIDEITHKAQEKTPCFCPQCAAY